MENSYVDPYEEIISGRTHEIIETCREGNLERFKTVLQHYLNDGRSLHVCDIKGWQAIHYACSFDDVQMLKALLEADEQLAISRTHENVTPLIAAAALGNLNAVQLLLEHLQDDDITAETVHGYNALYHAVKSEQKSEATEIALLILDRCSDYHFISNTTPFDSLPFRVVKNKNDTILKALFNAGLKTSFAVDIEAYSFHDEDYEIERFCEYSHPHSLASYMVMERWADGLKILIEHHKSSNSQPDLKTIFTSRYLWADPWDHYVNVSAWELVFVLGDKECLDIMLKEGLDLNEPLLDLPDSVLFAVPAFPCDVAFSCKVMEKGSFLQHLLLLLPLSKYEDNFYQHPPFTNRAHLVHYVLKLFEFQEYDSLTGLLSFFYDIGFKFEFQKIPSPIPNVETLCFSSFYLAGHYQNFSFFIELLKDTRFSIPIDEWSVYYAWESTVTKRYQSVLCPVLSALSRKPLDYVNHVFSCLHIENDYLFCHNITTQETVGNNWFEAYQLLSKGVQARYSSTKNTTGIPMSALFLTGINRRESLQKYITEKDHPIEKYAGMSSLLDLSREVIRKSVWKKLIFEPIPFSPYNIDPYLLDKSDSSEGTGSVVDKFPMLPKHLKDFLQYKPELKDFIDYVRKMIV